MTSLRKSSRHNGSHGIRPPGTSSRFNYPDRCGTLSDLLIGVSALELGYGVGTANVRHFQLIPGLNIIRAFSRVAQTGPPLGTQSGVDRPGIRRCGLLTDEPDD